MKRAGHASAARRSCGFEHLVDVFRLEEEIGSDYERQAKLFASPCRLPGTHQEVRLRRTTERKTLMSEKKGQG